MPGIQAPSTDRQWPSSQPRHIGIEGSYELPPGPVGLVQGSLYRNTALLQPKGTCPEGLLGFPQDRVRWGGVGLGRVRSFSHFILLAVPVPSLPRQPLQVF